MTKLFILCLTFFTASMVSAQQTVTINAPAAIAGKITSFSASDFGLLTAGQTVTGNVVIGVDSTVTDSTSKLIGCNKISNNVKGKIVLIRRGTCNFSLKTLNAQAAGAIGILVYVRSGETPFQTSRADTGTIKIPFAMITFTDAQKMVQAINLGTTTTVTFNAQSFFNPATTYNYVSPIKDSVFLALYSEFKNGTAGDLTKIQIKADIKAPSGTLITATNVIPLLPANADSIYAALTPYIPKEKGTYTVTYSNSYNKDSIFDKFIISDYTFAQDNLVADNAIGFDSATFINSGLVFDVGHVFLSGHAPTTITHVGFAVHNWTDIPKTDNFGVQIILYTADNDNSLYGGTLSYNDFKANTKTSEFYKITGKEKADSMVYLELKTPVKMVADTNYAVLIRYDGSGSANIKSPLFTTAGRRPLNYITQDLLYTYNPTNKANQFYSGYSDGSRHTVRAFTTGFVPPAVSGTNDLAAWEENQVTVFPNPISNNILQLQFDLTQNNKEVNLYVTDQMGRLISNSKLTNVQKSIRQINVGDLANGTYFVTIYGTDGWRTKLFQVAK